jgi:hypothetical protein
MMTPCIRIVRQLYRFLAGPQGVAIWLVVSCVWSLDCAARCCIDTLLSIFRVVNRNRCFVGGWDSCVSWCCLYVLHTRGWYARGHTLNRISILMSFYQNNLELAEVCTFFNLLWVVVSVTLQVCGVLWPLHVVSRYIDSTLQYGTDVCVVYHCRVNHKVVALRGMKRNWDNKHLWQKNFMPPDWKWFFLFSVIVELNATQNL